MNKRSTALASTLPLLMLAVFAVLSVAAGLAIGSSYVAPGNIIDALFGNGEPLTVSVIRDIRMPRVIAAFCTGSLLALAGTLMQVLLRNPLADPYILGVSGGAAVAALAALMLGLTGIWVDAGAFTGALGATLLVFTLAHGHGGWTPTRLLLTGVVIAAGFSAVISLMLALGSDSSLRGMLFWLMGDFSFVQNVNGTVIALVMAFAACMVLSRQLNVLARGDLQAQTLGVAVRPLRIAVYLLSSLITAIAVTTAGSIGFVGLVVPHSVRLLVGADHRLVIPGSVMLGGSLLVIADTLARTIAAPRQLPVGALTAAIGVPMFLLLMTRRRAIT